MNRRDFCRSVGIAALTAPLLSPSDLFAQQQPTPSTLWIARAGEEARLDFSTEAGYKQVAWILRDIKANKVGRPSIRVLQLAAWMQAWLAAYGHHVRFNATSGLRMPSTNKNIEGAARASLHLPDWQMIFRAIDFTTKTIPIEYMGRLAALAGQGGVGFYQDRQFLHIDDGRQRIWRGK